MGITFEGRQIAAEFEDLLEGFIILLVGLLHIDSGEGIVTPFQQFLSLRSMLAIRNQLEIHIPDVQIEDKKRFVIGVIFRIAGGAKVIEGDLPIQRIIVDRTLITRQYFFKVFSNGVIRGDGIDIVLGILKGFGLFAEFGGDHDLAFVEG